MGSAFETPLVFNISKHIITKVHKVKHFGN